MGEARVRAGNAVIFGQSRIDNYSRCVGTLCLLLELPQLVPISQNSLIPPVQVPSTPEMLSMPFHNLHHTLLGAMVLPVVLSDFCYRELINLQGTEILSVVLELLHQLTPISEIYLTLSTLAPSILEMLSVPFYNVPHTVLRAVELLVELSILGSCE